MGKISNKYWAVCIYLVLALTTLAVYWQVRNHDFVNYDDNVYVSDNANIQAGITLEGIRWAVTSTIARNWHPVTCLSLMLDYQLFGLNPGAFHMTNVLFHTANSLLLLLVFSKMTGRIWQSAFVAAVFALHPLHVESVAWVAERKDVLSAFFWMLTMWAYVRYAERPNPARYSLVTAFFVLGLMAKPMLVTLPFVLLLLDYWPLNRLRAGKLDSNGNSRRLDSVATTYQKSTVGGLVKEKIPLFIFSAVFSIITFLVQQQGGTMRSLEMIPLRIRIANAMVSYVNYIQKMIVPTKLAVFYPHPGNELPLSHAIIAAIAIVGISVVIIRYSRRRPYLAVGWLWYIGTLVPVIGLVQVGQQAMADRYSYVPLTGLFIIIAWGVPDILSRWRHRNIALALITAPVLIALMLTTRLQLCYWQNSITLFEHTINVTNNNHTAHNNLANALADEGKDEAAIAHYQKALQINPNYIRARYNLGNSLGKLGKLNDAVAHWTEVLCLDPNHADAHNNLGCVLLKQGKFDEAVSHFRQALNLKPNDLAVKNNLARAIEDRQKTEQALNYYTRANALADQSELDAAVEYYNKAIELKPNFIVARGRLGLTLAKKGNIDDAIKQFRIVLTDRPDDVEMRCNLGTLLEQQGKIDEAISQYRLALQANPDYTKAQKKLEAVLARKEDRQ
jgi:tetratricopeptide (TPR) repeat protein